MSTRKTHVPNSPIVFHQYHNRQITHRFCAGQSVAWSTRWSARLSTKSTKKLWFFPSLCQQDIEDTIAARFEKDRWYCLGRVNEHLEMLHSCRLRIGVGGGVESPFQIIIWLFRGAPLMPDDRSCCNHSESLVNLFLARVNMAKSNHYPAYSAPVWQAYILSWSRLGVDVYAALRMKRFKSSRPPLAYEALPPRSALGVGCFGISMGFWWLRDEGGNLEGKATETVIMSRE